MDSDCQVLNILKLLLSRENARIGASFRNIVSPFVTDIQPCIISVESEHAHEYLIFFHFLGCAHDDEKCYWETEFNQWCDEFDKYQKQFNNWVCVKVNLCFKFQ